MEKGKGKMSKGWGWSQKGKGKGKGLQSMNEWDQTDECVNPVDELQRKTARNRITRSEDTFRGVASSEQHRGKMMKQDRSTVRFECDGDVSTSCGGCEEERRETQVGNECESEDTERRKKDPNFVGILLSSSVESEPLCEIASEWTPMSQPLVVDSGVAETVIPSTWFQTTRQ